MTTWCGSVPPQDDFGVPIKSEFIDGRTREGPWAMMSPWSHRAYGVGLGTGKGQKYQKKEDGKWHKVQG